MSHTVPIDRAHGHDSSNKPHKPCVFVDKVSLTLQITDSDHRKYIKDTLINMPKEGNAGWISGGKGAYRVLARIYPPSFEVSPVASQWAKHFMLVQADPKQNSTSFLRLEWNPAHFTAPQRDDVLNKLDDFLSVSKTRLMKAKVTRVDVAVDLPGIELDQFVFERVKSPLRQLIYRGELQTLYLGAIAKGEVAIYDKAAHIESPEPLTRIEVRMRPQNYTAWTLASLQNPLKRIRVYDLRHADLGISVPHLLALNAAATAEGLARALATFPPAIAAKHDATIKSSKPEFWNPETLWQGWPAAWDRVLGLSTLL